MRLSSISPEGCEKSQFSISNSAQSPKRLELNGKNSIESYGERPSCFGSIINAITGLFRTLFNLITCNWSKTPEEKTEEPLTEENEEPALDETPSSTKPKITVREAATQFLDDSFLDPVKTFASQSDPEFTKWQPASDEQNPNELLKNAFILFLCMVQKNPSDKNPCEIHYQGHSFNIEHWMVAYYIDKYQPDLTKTIEGDISPLHLAKSKETAALLLAKCPGLLEKQARQGMTPLFAASEQNLDEVVECLIAHGANCLATDTERGDTALHRTESLKVAQLLLAKEKSLLNCKNSHSRIPLHKAIGNKELVAFYIEQGADLRATDNEGVIPLSCCYGREVAQLFLDKDMTLVKHRNAEGNTPLCYANTPEMAQFLLENGAEIDSLNGESQTPLRVLLQKDRHRQALPVAEVLIDRGADLDIQVGKEPLLHYLLDCVFEPVARQLFKKILAKRPQDTEVRDSENNQTLLQAAIERNYGDKKEYFEVIKLLIESGANLAIEIRGEPLLHFLVDRSREASWHAIFKTVLAKRPQDIEIPDSEGKTLLQYVVERNWNGEENYFEIIDLLIGQSANLDIKIGEEPLLHHILHRIRFNDRWRAIFSKVLQNRPQDSASQNSQGKTLLEHASDIVKSNDKYADIVDMLKALKK